MIIDWQQIDTVMLDMDGTILDLHYDNYFWQQCLPSFYAKKHGISFVESKEHLVPIFKEKEGQLDWYCIDYWSKELGIDLSEIKQDQDVIKKVAFRSDAHQFLKALRSMGKNVWLVTNAHPKVLEIKSQQVSFLEYFDFKISSHELGYAKENQQFWINLNQYQKFDVNRTLFIDDSLSVLNSAQEYGIKHIYGIEQPDSTQGPVKQNKHISLQSFSYLL